MEIVKEIKINIEKYKKDITLISGFITAITGFSNHFFWNKILELNFVLVTLGAYLIIRSVFVKVTNASVTRLGKEHWSYPEDKRVRARNILILNNWLFAIIILSSIGLYSYKYYISKKQGEKKFGIVITNFIETGKDRFSLDLGNCFNDSLYKFDKRDTIDAFNLNSYLPYYNRNKLENLRDTFYKSGYNHGMLVFGHRIDKNNEHSNDFQCRIFLCQAKNKIIDALTNGNRPVIKIPEIFDFRISDEVNKVYYFILGLIFNQLGDTDHADAKILTALHLDQATKKTETEENKFTAYCYLILGQNKITQKDYREAVKLYYTGISIDSTNVILHYNLGVALCYLNKQKDAFKEFTKANALNEEFKIPIANPIDEFQNNASTSSKIANNTAINKLTIIPVKTTSIEAIVNSAPAVNTISVRNPTYDAHTNSTLNLTPTNTPIQSTYENKNTEKEYIDISEIEYHVVLNFSKTNLGYITKDNDYIKFNSQSGDTYNVIGKMKRKGYNSYVIFDQYDKPIYSVVDKTIYIYTNNLAVGELRNVKR